MIKERYDLSLEKITEIERECGVNDGLLEKTACAFRNLASLWKKVCDLYSLCNEGKGVFGKSEEELKSFYDGLYRNILPQNYEKSLENPAYAVKKLKRRNGRLLSAMACDAYTVMNDAANGNTEILTIYLELFIEIYCLFRDAYADHDTPAEAEKSAYLHAKEAYRSFMNDNMEFFAEEALDAHYTAGRRMPAAVLDADLNDLRYLYMYGDYVTDNERKIARYMNGLTEEKVRDMADTLVSGFMRGFSVMNGKFKEGGITNFTYPAGFERMAKYVVKGLEEKKCRTAVRNATFRRRYHDDYGVAPVNVNNDFVYDHRNDRGLYYDRKYAAKHAEIFRNCLEKRKDELSLFNGPVLIEAFGKPDFVPVNRKESIAFTPAQDKIDMTYRLKEGEMLYNYINQEDIAFSVIAYPVPTIGEDFEKIFNDTIVINNLDNAEYIRMQQCMIDELDKGYAVHITGRNGNETDMTVALTEIKDSAKETVFENCTADVNIPAGEVFTSPKLKGTNGLLHVKKVFLGGLEYKDLRVRFKDGVTTEVTCHNYDDEEQNRRFVFENLLYKHDFLPLGEFAIGTNTTAYIMGIKFDIQAKLPILIAEKTGPHFAIGDTCYAHAEDHKVYNPNGKEIISRSNDFAELRNTDPEKAYFGCHTDITIPYDELGDISSLRKDGKAFDIIKNGRFAVKGTEKLNEVLDQKVK